MGLVLWRVLGPVWSPRFSGPQTHPWKVSARSVFLGNHEFIVRQTGDPSKPSLILIHGLGGASLTEWYEVGPRLADDFHLTIVENRNHGLSPHFSRGFEVEDVADDIAGVMAQLGIDAAHVVGYSMGGTVAQALAYRHPSRVDRIVLIATFAFHPPVWRWSRMLGTLITRAWERVTGLGTPEVRTGYLLASGAVKRQYSKFMWDENHRRDPDAGAAASMALFRFDSRPWVSSITNKTMVVVPSKDQLVPIKWQRDLRDRLPNSEMTTIEGARHEVVWTNPDEIAEAVRGFLGS